MTSSRACRRALAAASAAVAAVAWLGAVAVPAGAAGAPAGPRISLVSQSNWVTPSQAGGQATFTLALSVVGVPADAEVAVSLYSRLITRSLFEATTHSSPSQNDPELDHTAPVALSGLPPGPTTGSIDLRVAVVTSGTAGATPSPGTPSLDLACTTAGNGCTGVYPAVVTLKNRGGGTLDQFTTYLTYAVGASPDPLQFAWVVPVSAPTSVVRGAANPADALAPLAPATAASLAGLLTALHGANPPVPVTIQPTPQTVQALAASGAAGRAAVAELASMSTRQAVDETIGQTYVPVDLGALAGAGEPTEITAQLKASEAVLQPDKVPVGSPTTWVATGQVAASTGIGLDDVRATHVVVPDTQLAAPTVGTAVTWGWPFELSFGGNGPTLDAAASDSVLATQFTADPGDPALAAAQLVADLAMIHFERPYTKPRGVVAVPPAGWQPTTAFDRQLLAGLQNNPVVQPVTLSTFFSTVSMPTPPTRHLQSSGGGPALPAPVAKELTTARARLTAFNGAVRGDPPLLAQLDEVLLASEASYRDAAGMRSAVDAYDRVFAHQVDLVQLSTNRSDSVTLTARTGWIPVTVVSGAPYTIEGTLTVTSSKFKFPQAASGCTGAVHPARSGTAEARSTSCALALDHSTNPVRIDVIARTLGDSPVTVVFSVPGLVFARGQITVRSTATSVVGVILTALALAVLLGWWARTWWSGRRRRLAARGV